MTKVREILDQRYPGADRRKEYFVPILEKFVKSGCADKEYLNELTKPGYDYFWSRVWEAVLHKSLDEIGHKITNLGSEGPDFVVQTDSSTVLVEATVPKPEGISTDWLNTDAGVKSMPHEQMLLRWTNSLSTKAKKHGEDINNGAVDSRDPFVIAVNSVMLSSSPHLHGITGRPFAVEATFPIGPMAVNVNRETGELGEAYQSLRFSVTKDNGKPIPTDNFLNPDYSHVSALIGASTICGELNRTGEIVGMPPYILVHNPMAANPLPDKFLPDATEYRAEQTSKTEWKLFKVA